MTVVEPLALVQAAVFTQLRAHAGLLALVPSTRILDAVPERETFPYVVYDAPDSLPDRTFGEDGREISFVITVFTRDGSEKAGTTGAAGFKSALEIADQLVQALIGTYPATLGFTPVAVPDFTVSDVDVVSVQAGRANDGISRQVDCTFRLLLRSTPT